MFFELVFQSVGSRSFSSSYFTKNSPLKKKKKRKGKKRKEVENQAYVTVNGMMESRLYDTFPGIPSSLCNISRSLTFKTPLLKLHNPITFYRRPFLGVPFFIFIQSK